MSNEPQIKLGDVINGYLAQGLADDEMKKRLASRGINLDALGEDALEKKFRMTIGEYAIATSKAADIEGLQKDFFRRGIMNPAALSVEDYDKILPAARQELNAADRILMEAHPKNLANGIYDAWNWDSSIKEKDQRRSNIKSMIQGLNPNLDVNKIDEWVDAHSYNEKQRRAYDSVEFGPAFFDDRPKPDLNDEELDLANRIYNTRMSLRKSRGALSASTTGGVISLVTGFADLMGIVPKAEGEKGIKAWAKDIAAEGMAWALLHTPDEIDKQKRFKNTKQGKALLTSVLKRRAKAVDELSDMQGRYESYSLDRGSLVEAFGDAYNRDGKVTRKGYVSVRGVNEEKLLKDIHETMRMEDRINKEKSYKSFTSWLNTALPKQLQIDHEENARQSRKSLDMQHAKRLKNMPGLTDRGVAELIDIWDGIWQITSYVATPGKENSVEGLADIVASGKMTEEEARDLLEEKGFKEGAGFAGGMAGWVMGFTTDKETFIQQIRNEPVSSVLAVIPVLHTLKGLKAAGAATALKNAKALAKKAGYTDQQILDAAKRGEDLATKDNRVMLRRWLDSARGKHSQSKFLEKLDKWGAPEVITGATKLAAASVILSDQAGDAAFYGGVGAALGGMRHLIRRSPTTMRVLDDVTAAATAENEGINRNVLNIIEENNGERSALQNAAEDMRRRGLVFDPTDDLLESGLDTNAILDLKSRLNAEVDRDPEVMRLRRLYLEAPLASPEKSAYRTQVYTARAEALVRLVEGTEDNPGISFIRASEGWGTGLDDLVTDLRARSKKREEKIAKIEEKRDSILDEMAEEQSKKTLAERVSQLNEKIVTQRKAVDNLNAEADRLTELYNNQYDANWNNLESLLAERREGKAKGRDKSRRQEVEGAERRLKGVEATLQRSVDELKKIDEEILKVPKDRPKDLALWKERRKAQVKNIKFNTEAYVRTEKELKARQAEFDDPGVPLKLGKKGQTIKGKVRSYIEVRQELFDAHESKMKEVSELRRKAEERELSKQQFLDEVVDLETTALKDIEADIPERVLVEAQKKQDNAQKEIDAINALNEKDRANVQGVLDSATRAKAAEYRRAIDAAFGLHVNDGKYVVNINTPVRFRSVVSSDGAAVAGTRRFTPIGKDEFGDTPYVEMANGYRGTSESFDLSTGNSLARLNAFPTSQTPSIVRAIGRVVDTALENVDGLNTPETRVDLAQIRKALREKAKGKDGVHKDDWAEKAVRDVTDGTLNNRGVNDLKRIMLDSYGDMVTNIMTPRVLVDATARKSFVKFAEKIITDHVLTRIGPRGNKADLEMFRADISNMATDFAQGRTLNDRGTFGRVSYSFLDDNGKPFKYKGVDGRSKDLTIENLFEEWAHGNVSASTMKRARQRALSDALYFTARAADGRMAIEEAVLKATGISRKLWDRGGADPEYQASVMKYLLKTGKLPPAVRITIGNNNNILMNAKESGNALAILKGLVDDPEINTRGLRLEDAANELDNALTNTIRRETGNRATDYVAMGSKEDVSNIPGIERIGARPLPDPQVGLTSTHNIVQPEHISSIGRSINESMDAKFGSDVFIQRELSESFGWMLDTHDSIQATEKGVLGHLQGLSTLFKWGKTAGSLVNPMTNYASNIKTMMINQGLNPVNAWLNPMATADLWRQYRAGALKGTDAEKKLDALMRTGFADQSQLVVEVDKALQSLYASGRSNGFTQSMDDLLRAGQVGDKRLVGIREMTEVQDFLYRKFGDELFKLTDALTEWTKKEAELDVLPVGSSITYSDLNTGAGFANAKTIGTITRIDDAAGNQFAIVYKSGKNRGKVIRVKSLADEAASDLIAKATMGHANSLYYDLTKTGTGIKMGRRFESIAVQPFLSWRTKALDIPMVKKGMFYRMFGDDMYTYSDSAKVNLLIHGEAASRAMRRYFWVQVGKGQTEDGGDIRRFLPRWASNAILSDGDNGMMRILVPESSNPIGGMIWMAEMLADTDRFMRGDEGEKKFWDMVHGDTGPTPSITEATKQLFSGGAVTQILFAIGGHNPLTGDPYKGWDERGAAIVKAIAPGWFNRTGMVDALSGGTLKTDSIPRQILDQMRAKMDFDVDKLGQAATIKQYRSSADDSVAIINTLLARKYRTVDPIWLTNVIANIPDRLTDRIIKIQDEGAKKGTPKEEIDRETQILKDAVQAYRRHIPMMAQRLRAQGLKGKKMDKLDKKIKKLVERW